MTSPTPATPPLLERLSSPRVRSAPRRELTQDEINILRRIARALIPAGENDGEIAGSDIGTFDDLAREALAIMDPQFDLIVAALDLVKECPDDGLFDALRDMDHQSPLEFHAVSLLVSGIYIYSPEMEQTLAYPHPRRNPGSPDTVVDEIESGILDPVIERGPIWVDVQ